MRSARRSRASLATFSALSRQRRVNGAQADERQQHRQFQRSLFLRLDADRDRRDRTLLSHPRGARTVEPAKRAVPVMLLSIHIAAGGLAIVLGAVALLVKKGGTIHRRSGLLFVCSMLVLGTTAALLGFRKSPTDGNVFGGLMTVYFVVTALTAVRPVSAWTRRSNVAALIVAVGLALIDIAGGVKAFNSPRGSLNGVPFVMHFFIAGVMILAATGDVRIMRFGVPRGGQRLARHLWRMCFALFIAAGSLFSIRERVAKILTQPFTTAPMRALPILLVFGAMFYWLWRVRRRTLPVLLQPDSMPLTTRAK